MFKITLDEAQMNNLITFLNRTNLTGQEAIPYVQLLQQIESAEKVEVETKS